MLSRTNKNNDNNWLMNENTLIFPAVFDRNKDKWNLVYEPGTHTYTDTLTLVTFNTWFGDFHFEERLKSITAILRKAKADIIALQEITNASLEIILNEEWIKDNYFISDISGSTFYSYGVLLLSRIPIKNLNLHPMTNVMDRHVLIAEFKINEQKLLIATTHLESLKHSAKIRSVQLNDIFTLLNNSDNSILMGDFNFCSSWEENSNIDDGYIDLWEILRPNESGYTEDTDINVMRKQLKREEKKVRFDRIISRSSPPSWKPKNIKRIGMKPISSEFPEIFPSDHFGLIGIFEWGKNNNF